MIHPLSKSLTGSYLISYLILFDYISSFLIKTKQPLAVPKLNEESIEDAGSGMVIGSITMAREGKWFKKRQGPGGKSIKGGKLWCC